jgi:hypothetical protein
MLIEDRPKHPMTFVIEAVVRGELDRTAFESAVEEALHRHPLLQSLVKPAKRDLPCWVHDPNLRPMLDWNDEGQPLDCPAGEPIDLTLEAGVRIWVRQGDGRARATFQFHHACCDGIGAHRFIGDLLCAYGQRTAPANARPTFGEIDPELLKTRTFRMRYHGALDERYRGRLAAIRYAHRTLRKSFTPIRPPAGVKERSGQRLAPYFGIYAETLDRDQYRQLRDAAVRLGVTHNDLLISELLRTIYAWNGDTAFWQRRKQLGILMPADLRGRNDELMPAANMVSYTFVARMLRDCRDRGALARNVHSETLRIKHLGLGSAFIEALIWALGLRGLLPLLVSGRRCLASSVLTNLGDETRRYTAKFPREEGRLVCGNAQVEQFLGSPPLRSKTRAAFAISSYQRKLTVCIRCDPWLFHPDAARKLLQLYVDGLRQWAQGKLA